MAHDNTLDDEELWKTSGRRRVTESTLAESRALDWADVKMELSAAGREDLALFVHAKLEALYDARLERMTAAALSGLLSNPITGDGALWESADEWEKEMASSSAGFAVATCLALDKFRAINVREKYSQ